MNKQGFTLVEILAVIIILSLITLLTSTAVTKVVKETKIDISSAQKRLIQSASEAWIADNIDRLPDGGKCAYLTLEDLKEYGLLESSIINSNTGKEIPNDTKIKITASLNEYNKLNYTYEVDADDISSCTHANSNL